MYLFDIIEPKLKTNQSDIITLCRTNVSFISKVNVLCCLGDDEFCDGPSWVFFATIGAMLEASMDEMRDKKPDLHLTDKRSYVF